MGSLGLRLGHDGIPATLTKVADVQALARESNVIIDIEVDGGVAPSTIAACAKAGANIFVVGSALFGQKDYEVALAELNYALKDKA